MTDPSKGGFIPNGIDADTGAPVLPPLQASSVAKLARGEGMDPALAKDLAYWKRSRAAGHLGVMEGVDPKDLAQAGWGVVIGAGVDPAIREALDPLIKLRKEQASARDERLFREITGDGAPREGESKQAFLARHGEGPGPIDPKNLPYYLLLVGDPTAIPYRLQYQVDVQHAVGRLWLPTADAFARYAEAVVAAETGRVRRARRSSFLATDHDDATEMSRAYLAEPLVEDVQAHAPAWSVDAAIGAAATKARLTALLSDPGGPALLFTATHGIAHSCGDPRQRQRQGALLCQDWAGGPVMDAHAFAADDLGEAVDVSGLVAFHFACYGAGTPRSEDFVAQAGQAPRVIAPEAFVAALPQRMLSHPRGAALACVGHVDMAWGWSFGWEGIGEQTQAYRSVMKRLLDGHPVGSAMEYMNQRYAELASDLASTLEEAKYGKAPDDAALAQSWTATNDARNFVVLGDPAVRLAVGDAPAASVE